MTPDELKQVKLTLLAMSEYYEKTVSDAALKMMASDLADLPFESVMKAFETYRKDAKNIRFPMPAQIRAIAAPQLTDTQTALGLAQEIIHRIKGKGERWDRFVNGQFVWGAGQFRTYEEAVKDELGELGWAVIRSYGGGWAGLHDTYWQSQGTYFAQSLEKFIESVMARMRTGSLPSRASLPTPNNMTRITEGPKKLSETTIAVLNKTTRRS
jgi:hypothetical protein